MMNTRLALHKILEDILNGHGRVYFQPPTNTQLVYPCIIYSLSKTKEKHADDKKYLRDYAYKVTLICKDSDNEYLDKILDLKYSDFVNSFSNQGLYHYVFTIYYKNEKEIK